MRILIPVLGFIILTFGNFSCVSYPKLLSYQEEWPDSLGVLYYQVPELKVVPNDILKIVVTGGNEETAAPFNLAEDANLGFGPNAIQYSGYLVDKKGEIDFPILGKIKLAGLSTSEAKDKITNLLNMFLKDPVVNLRILNFKVTVSGEVFQPGSFFITNERITLPDVLSLAGGITPYANRTNILIIREDAGVITRSRVNLQKMDFLASEFYYLKQNDLIYVEPLKSKAGAMPDQTNKVVPIISALGTVAAILIALFQK
jgi:polysaccharide export outer membrane protein